MSDIVERLRFCEHYEWSPLMHEAANEIERLRGEVSWPFLEETEFQLRVEIATLRALLRRHQVCAWCEYDSDLAEETRAALEPKP